MMYEAIKAKWLEYLRDGTRTQGKYRLRFETAAGGVEQCCLDVLCEVAVDYGIIPAPYKINSAAFVYEDGPEGVQSDVLPAAVRDWAGLDSDDPYTGDIVLEDVSFISTTLSGLNDIHGYTFEQIADVIEEKL